MSDRVLLSHVATEAGVSAQTVSRVVRGNAHVSARTREVVQEAISRLGYKPNLAARALATNRTGVIQIILAGPMFHGHAEAFVAISAAVDEAGYHVSISIADQERLSNRKIHTGLGVDVDAVVVLGAYDSAARIAQSYADDGMPAVLLLSGQMKLSGVSVISVDQRVGSELVVNHLLDQGVDEILHIAGPESWVDARERLDGFRQRCTALGLRHRWIESETWNALSGYQIAQAEISATGTGCRAVFAANDQIALGYMRALHEAGIRIPQQVAVVGFDDSLGSSNYFPPLTTVVQDFEGMGREAVASLASMLRTGRVRNCTIAPMLIVRDSSS